MEPGGGPAAARRDAQLVLRPSWHFSKPVSVAVSWSRRRRMGRGRQGELVCHQATLMPAVGSWDGRWAIEAHNRGFVGDRAERLGKCGDRNRVAPALSPTPQPPASLLLGPAPQSAPCVMLQPRLSSGPAPPTQQLYYSNPHGALISRDPPEPVGTTTTTTTGLPGDAGEAEGGTA